MNKILKSTGQLAIAAVIGVAGVAAAQDGSGTLIAAWNNTDHILVSRSTDVGLSWSPAFALDTGENVNLDRPGHVVRFLAGTRRRSR